MISESDSENFFEVDSDEEDRQENERRIQAFNLKRRLIRDNSNPFEITEREFIKNYRYLFQ